MVLDGHPCPEPVDPGSPLNLCATHLLVAYDWVSRDVGVTDVLPSPCLACGSRSNPRLRLASLPHDEVLAFERGDRRVEQRRHAQFAEHRFPGTEWFAVHDALLAHIAELRAGVDEPWSAYELWMSRALALRGSS